MTRLGPYRFAGRTALLTGAASGIGEHLAYELAARGSDLVLVDVDGRRLDAVAGQIRAAHPGCAVTAIAVDLAERAEVDSLIAQVLADHPALGLLVNNAGVGVTTVYPGGIRTRIAVNALVGDGVPVRETLSRGRSVSALLTYPPEMAARQILDAVVRRKPRLLIAVSAKVPDALARLMPVRFETILDTHAMVRIMAAD